MAQKKKRVFLVDYQAVSPLGVNNKELFESIVAQRRCGAPLHEYGQAAAHIGAEVRHSLESYYASEHDVIKEICFRNRKMELAISCYNMLEPRLASYLTACDPERRAIAFGWGIDIVNVARVPQGKQEESLVDLLQSHNRQLGRINTAFNPSDIASVLLAQKAELFGWQKTILTACAASSQAIGMAFESIQAGEIDMALAGGSDSLFDPISFSGFSKLGIVARRYEDPAEACRPFDLNRRGALLGEGGGLLVLVNEEIVEKVGCTPKLELIGYGTSLDGYKITAPDPEGKGIRTAITEALHNAEISPESVDYVNMHGTGTVANDDVELRIVDEIFGQSDKPVLASSTKDRHGHQIAAAGVQEMIVTAMAMENSLVPSTVNLEKPLASSGIELVQGENRVQELTVCVSNSFAFGGVNSVLILKRVS